MKDINYIEELKNNISQISSMYNGLNELICKIQTTIKKDELISEALNLSVKDQLNAIADLQNKFIEKYEQLKIGSIPKKVSQFKINLDNHLQNLSKKNI